MLNMLYVPRGLAEVAQLLSKGLQAGFAASTMCTVGQASCTIKLSASVILDMHVAHLTADGALGD